MNETTRILWTLILFASSFVMFIVSVIRSTAHGLHNAYSNEGFFSKSRSKRRASGLRSWLITAMLFFAAIALICDGAGL